VKYEDGHDLYVMRSYCVFYTKMSHTNTHPHNPHTHEMMCSCYETRKSDLASSVNGVLIPFMTDR